MEMQKGILLKVCDTYQEVKVETNKYNKEIGAYAIQIIEKNGKYEIWNFAVTTVEEKINAYMDDIERKMPRMYLVRKENFTKQSATISFILLVIGLISGVGFFIALPLALINLWLASRAEQKRKTQNIHLLKRYALHFSVFERSARMFHKKYFYTQKDFDIAEKLKNVIIKGIDKRYLNEVDAVFLVKLINDREMFERVLNYPNDDVLRKRRKRFFNIIDEKTSCFKAIKDEMSKDEILTAEYYNEDMLYKFLNITTKDFKGKREDMKKYAQYDGFINF